MLKKRLIQMVSAVLVALTVSQIPVTVMAQTNDTKEDAQPTSAYIISEVEEKRTNNEKHFRMSDGTFMVAQYGYDVHYQDENGKYKDIDNTLTIEDSSKNENDQMLASKAGKTKFKISKKAKDNNMIRLNGENYKLSWGYEGANKSRFSVIDDDNDYSGNDSFLHLKNISSYGVFKNIYDDIDLAVSISSEQIKENLIVKKKKANYDYTINYNIGNLKAEIIDKQTIALKDKSGKEIYTICAPLMTDNALSESRSISFEIIENKNSKLSVKVVPDASWMNSESREYPVTIDPYVTTKRTSSDIEDYYTDNSQPNSTFPADQYLYVGNNTYGKCRSYVRFVLPEIESGSIITGATLSLYQEESDWDHSTEYIEVRENAFDPSNLTWNSSENTDWLSNPILDYRQLAANDDGKFLSFDVTSAVKKWYLNNLTKDNTGFAIKLKSESAGTRIRFLSSNNTIYSNASVGYPMMAIMYLHTGGLESHWSYHDQNLGCAGKGYVNDMTGNLTTVTPLTETTGSVLPVSVNAVYNGINKKAFIDGGSSTIGHYGYGFQLNYSKRIEKVTDSRLSSNFPYRLLDEDGTYHYFKKKGDQSNVWEDEEGFNWELKKENNLFTLYYKDGTKEIYADAGSKLGVIYYSYDIYNNYIEYAYDSNDKLVWINDGTKRKTTFTYDTQSRALTAITTPDNRTTSLWYIGHHLCRITYPNGNIITFEYNDDGRMYKITDTSPATNVSGSEVRYYYKNSSYNSEANRVSRIEEYSSDANGSKQKGAILHLFYKPGNKTEIGYDFNGNGVAEYFETYTFSNVGQLICAETPMGSSTAKYKSSTYNSDKNKVESSGTSSPNVANIARNNSAERSSDWSTYIPSGATNYTLTYDSSTSYIGSKSLKISQNSASPKRVGFYENISVATVTQSKTATFSAYVKTNNVAEDTNKGALLYVEFYGANGYIGGCDGSGIFGTNDWTRIKNSFTVPVGTTTIRVHGVLKGVNGTMWMDAVQLEWGDQMNEYNMVEDSEFYYGSSQWTSKNLASGDGRQTSNNTYRITGRPGVDTYVKQNIPINKAGVCFNFSGTAFANSVSTDKESRSFELVVGMYYADGSPTTWSVAKFSPDTSGNQYTCGQIAPKYTDKVISSIDIFATYYKNCNYAYFDDICVFIDESGSSYSYDSKGNIISSSDNAKRTQIYSYNDANALTSYTDKKNDSYTFAYHTGNDRQVRSAKLNNTTYGNGKLGYYFNYDGKGNIVNTKYGSIKSDGDLDGSYPSIQTFTTMTSNKQYVASETDQRGKVTTYDVNQTSGQVNKATQPNGNVVNYQYDSATKQLNKVTTNGISVEYGYTKNGSLSNIKRNGFNYKLTYDEWGNQKTVSVENRLLITNNYASNNGLLTDSVYGNSDTVNYVYDKFRRITGKGFNGTQRFTYGYNKSGRLSKISELQNGVNHEYYYDIEGKLIERKDSNGNGQKFIYDNVGRVISNTYTFGGQTKKTTHQYLKDGRYNQCTMINDYIVTREFDGLNRIKITDTESSSRSDPKLRTYYEYAANGTNTTTIVSKISNSRRTGGADNMIGEYSYTYDNNGNIASVIEQNSRTYYQYDALNQLVRETTGTYDSSTDRITGTQTTYQYDIGGNRTGVTKLTGEFYTNGTVYSQTSSTTDEYTYGDSSFKDKLTSVNGVALTYDQIGNPLTYGNKSYTWEGRRLKTATDESGNTVTLFYDYNNMLIKKSLSSGDETFMRDDGGNLLAEKRKDGSYIYYLYDTDGTVKGFTYNNSSYFYTKNLQGDVTAILDSNMNVMVLYKYDAYGNLISMTDANGNSVLSDASNIGNINRIRYRSYYFDTITGFYLTGIRCYDPEIGRFINADGQLNPQEGMTGYNLFQYCGNNPVNRIDPTGEAWWHWALGAAVVAACAIATVVTCGGFAAAVGAVAAVGSGVAAATTVSTIAAGAFIGSATIYGMAVVTAASTSSSVKDFNDKGNWGTVAATAGGAVVGGAGAYLGTKGSNTTSSTTKSKVTLTIKNDVIDLPRTGSALKTDPYHAFPNIVDNYAGYATKCHINNGTLYQLQGSLNGTVGRFEWIIQNQQVTHRMFVPGGGINGIPIMP